MAYLDNMTPSQLLSAIGLNRAAKAVAPKTDVTLSLTLFGVGLVVGAGLALVLAPKTGRELRDDLSRQANRLSSAVRERIPSLPGRREQDAWENAASVP